VEDYGEREEKEESGVYDPTLKEIPKRYLRIYQLCDIEERRIDDIVKNTRIAVSGCSREDGWFTKGEFN
jgi:hypothetical protein